MKKCQNCGKLIIKKDERNKFCSRSCAISFNNIGVRRHGSKPTNKNCLFCNKKVDRNKFCSKECRIALNEEKAFQQLLVVGVDSSYNHKIAKKYLIKLNKGKCQICGLSEWLSQNMPLVLDHIDGNSENGILDNLRVICNNCDALTPTFKSKNKGKGRFLRRQRYTEGKSY